MQIQKVILVFKTHIDIGFTRLSSEVLDFYAGDMLDRVAQTCDATREMGPLKYVWTMPAWPLQVMRERSDEARRVVLDDLVARGQLTWHALPYTSHYDFCGVEDAVWGLNYGRELSERYGQPLRRAAKMTDVPGHGRILPELLADAGIRFLHLGCNEFAMPPQVPEIFWWEAPSGKRVLTMYNSGYGTGPLPPEGWPFATWMALMNTNDNCGPQSSEIVEAVYQKIHARYPDAEVVCGTLEDVWAALEKEDLSRLPVVRADLADTWIHGVGSYPREVSVIRRLRGRLERLSRALAQRPDAPQADQVRREMARARDAMALFGEHTWGLDVKTWLGAIPDYDDFDHYRSTSPVCARMEESWREQSDRAAEAEAACARAERAMGLESAHVFQWTQGETLHGEQSLAGERYRLDFSADTGVIHGLYDRKLDCALLTEREGAGVFSYRYDRYGADDMTEYLRAYAHRFSDWGLADNGRLQYPECDHAVRRPTFVGCARSGRTLQFRYAASEGERLGDADAVVLYVTIPEGDAPVRVRLEIQGKRATPYVESGAICMPLDAAEPKYFVNKTGSVLDPRTDIAPNANHAFYALEHFIAAQDGRAMVGVVSHDCPLVSIGENGVHQFRKEYAPHRPELRFCLFNNMWGTNFPQWVEGDMAFEFDVLGMEPDRVAEMYAAASDLARNPDAVDEAELPFECSGFLRATGLSVGDDGLCIRVHSLAPERRQGVVRGEGWRFEEIDLMGRPTGAQWTDAVDTAFAPYELRTFRARKAR